MEIDVLKIHKTSLAYALSIVSQFIYHPREQHMNARLHILRYLKCAIGKGILFTKNIDSQSVDIYIYICVDVDYAGIINDRQCTLSYFTTNPTILRE